MTSQFSARPSRANVTTEDCTAWQIQPNINPRTTVQGRNNPITSTGPIYNAYLKGCFDQFVHKVTGIANYLPSLEAQIQAKQIDLQALTNYIQSIRSALLDEFRNHPEQYNESIRQNYLDLLNKEETSKINLWNRLNPSRRASSPARTGKSIIEKDMFKSIQENLKKYPSEEWTIKDERHLEKNVMGVLKSIDEFLKDNTSTDQIFYSMYLFIYILLQIDHYATSRDKFHHELYPIIEEAVSDYSTSYGGSIYVKALYTYLQYKSSIAVKSTNNRMFPLKIEQWKNYIDNVKYQIVKDLKLEETFDTELRDKLLEALNITTKITKEIYQWSWYFITAKIDYTRPRELPYAGHLAIEELKKIYDTAPSGRSYLPKPSPETETLKQVSCEGMILMYQPIYKKFVEQLTLGCSLLVKNCGIPEARSALLREYELGFPETSSQILKEDILLFNIDRPIALAELFQYWKSFAPGMDRKDFWVRYYNVTFKDEPGIFIGLERELLQLCMDQLIKETTFFIPCESSEKDARYRIQYDFNVSESFLKLFKLKTLTHDIRLDFAIFVGGLLSRCILMQIELPIPLSYYTLSYLLHKNDISLETWVLYFRMDYPDIAKSLFNYLQYDKDTLKSLDMKFNDIYDIVDEKNNHPITDKTLTTYLNRMSQYIVYKQYNDDEHYHSLLDAFYEGFIFSRKYLKENQIDIATLDKLIHLHGGTFTKDIVSTFIKEQLKFKLSPYRERMTPEEHQERTELRNKQESIQNWMISILENKVPFPYDELGMEPLKDEANKQYFYEKFLPSLFYFWTSMKSIRPSQPFVIRFLPELNEQKRPSSHTCTYTMDIPSGYRSDKQLYERLVQAVYGSQGFGFAGGSPLKMEVITQKCMNKVLQKCSIEKDYNKAFLCSWIETLKCYQIFTSKQKKLMIHYAKKHPIDFKNATKKQMKKWTQEIERQQK